eukprot:TRINITY_DN459_c0_g2_i2.p2 TRINITY_DN459_c0_g2~~TRINITY_DN459_c0_g2_i2.p2  ORF type:complete len:183 (-),score=93.45 TRINITY_DN459_c0_g2_i2:527-1075(-)
MDGVDLIIKEHREVDSLFDAFKRNIGNPNEIEKIKGDVVRLLTQHAEMEEMGLYPVVEQHLQDGKAMAAVARDEHNEAKKVLYELDQMKAGDLEVVPKFDELIAYITQHVKEEESGMLRQLKETLKKDQLIELAKNLENYRKTAPTHPTLPQKSPSQIIAETGSKIADKAREAAQAAFSEAK